MYEVELLSTLYFRNFYRVLKSRVDNYFKENNIVSVHRIMYVITINMQVRNLPWSIDSDTQDPKIDYWMFLRYIVLFIIANLGWFGVVSPFGIGIPWESV